MADNEAGKTGTPGNGGSPEAGADAADTGGDANTGRPQMSITAQYLKDLSFENPAAPGSLAAGLAAPKIEVNVDVQAKPMGEDRFEVVLRITATASRDSAGVFVAEVLYAGLFGFQNMGQDALHAACLIECPRILFPYARRIVSDVTRDGGFPPLFLDPIVFAGLYRQHVERAQAEKQAAAAPKN